MKINNECGNNNKSFAKKIANLPCTWGVQSLTWLSSPIMKIMRKNMMAQKWEMGILVTASGYTIKMRPGPWVTTFSMGLPVE